jgi:hypothetical protein
VVQLRLPGGQDPYAVLPILDVDYQASPLGGRNGAVAGRPVTIDLHIARQEGAPPSEVVAATLQLSTNDGATWKEIHARAGRARPLPRRAPGLAPPRRHLGEPAGHRPATHQQPRGPGLIRAFRCVREALG